MQHRGLVDDGRRRPRRRGRAPPPWRSSRRPGGTAGPSAGGAPGLRRASSGSTTAAIHAARSGARRRSTTQRLGLAGPTPRPGPGRARRPSADCPRPGRRTAGTRGRAGWPSRTPRTGAAGRRRSRSCTSEMTTAPLTAAITEVTRARPAAAGQLGQPEPVGGDHQHPDVEQRPAEPERPGVGVGRVGDEPGVPDDRPTTGRDDAAVEREARAAPH